MTIPRWLACHALSTALSFHLRPPGRCHYRLFSRISTASAPLLSHKVVKSSGVSAAHVPPPASSRSFTWPLSPKTPQAHLIRKVRRPMLLAELCPTRRNYVVASSSIPSAHFICRFQFNSVPGP